MTTKKQELGLGKDMTAEMMERFRTFLEGLSEQRVYGVNFQEISTEDSNPRFSLEVVLSPAEE